MMAKMKGNAHNTKGFFTNGGGRKPAETVKHRMTKTSQARRSVKPVKAEPRVGVY